MKKIVFFPYHPDLEIIVKNIDKLIEYEVVGFISYKEDDHLIEALCKQLQIKRMTTSELLKVCDAIIVLENYRNFKFDKYYEIINEAFLSDIEVIVATELTQKMNFGVYGSKVTYLENIFESEVSFDEYYEIHKQLETKENLLNINIPVIAIIGMGKNCGKFETQLTTKKVLEEKYSVIGVSSNPLGVLFGCYTFPTCLYENISFENKVMRINYYLHQLSKIQGVDALVICIPEGIAPFKEFETNRFAEYPLVVTSSVDIDLAILCTYYFEGGIGQQGIRSFANVIYNRFGVRVGGVAMSTTLFELPSDGESGVIYEFLNYEYIKRNYIKLIDVDRTIGISMDSESENIHAIRRCIAVLENNVVAV